MQINCDYTNPRIQMMHVNLPMCILDSSVVGVVFWQPCESWHILLAVKCSRLAHMFAPIATPVPEVLLHGLLLAGEDPLVVLHGRPPLLLLLAQLVLGWCVGLNDWKGGIWNIKASLLTDLELYHFIKSASMDKLHFNEVNFSPDFLHFLSLFFNF